MGAVATTGRWADQLMATGANAVALIEQARALAGSTIVVAGEEPVDVERLGLPAAATVVRIAGGQPVPPVEVAAAGHIVIDTSSLSAARTYGVLCQLLDLERDGRFRGEIQVVVGGGPAPGPNGGHGDEEGNVDAAGPWAPFGVWVPVLSEGAGPELTRLYRRLRPHEVCPVLPFPSRNARRADELVLEHRDLLFGEMRIDLRNVIYAHESDPSDLYRALAGMHRRRQSHGLAAPPTVAVTPGTGKLLALGAFLASYDCGIPVVWRRGGAWGDRSGEAHLSCVWVAGAPYRTAP